MDCRGKRLKKQIIKMPYFQSKVKVYRLGNDGWDSISILESLRAWLWSQIACKHARLPQFSLIQFSRSVMSDSLQPHESQHARPPCPSPAPGVHSDSRPSSPWCHPAISSSVIPFSSCCQSLPASESFQMSQLFSWGGQSTGVSALASFLPKKS